MLFIYVVPLFQALVSISISSVVIVSIYRLQKMSGMFFAM